jgi:hypothetical protein
VKTEQHRIGERAERMLAEHLRKHYGCWVKTNDGRNPDLSFGSDWLKYEYACEVKTVLHRYSNGRSGYAKIERAQMVAMHDMRTESVYTIMVAELRPNNYADRVYIVVDWEKIYNKYLTTRPEMMSLTFFQILNLGVSLDFWLRTMQKGVMEL